MTDVIEVDRFGDPGCPWDYSSEPNRLRMVWHYGHQLRMTPRMVVLSDNPDDYARKGFGVDELTPALAMIQGRFDMPIDLGRRERMLGTRAACLPVVAALSISTEAGERLLRELRIAAMRGELIDEQDVLRAAAAAAGVDWDELERRSASEDVLAQLEADWLAARTPTDAARRLDHKLAGWSRGEESGRRYTCPSWVFRDPASGRTTAAPGFQPFESLEVALAEVAPSLSRRDAPESVDEVLTWHDGPIATAEVAALCQLSLADARAALAAAGAQAVPIGPEALWTT